jgi:hypothetical protein
MGGGTSTSRGGPWMASIQGTTILGFRIRIDLHNKSCDSHSGTYRCWMRPGTSYPVRCLPSFDTKTATTNVWFQVPCIGPEIEGFQFNFNNRLRQRLSAYCKNTNRRPDNYSNVITKQSSSISYFYFILFYLFIFHGAIAPNGARPPHYRSFAITLTTNLTPYDSSGRVISQAQRPLPDNTQHSQETNIHAPGGIRTHNLSKRAVADPRLRPRGHWDGLSSFNTVRETGKLSFHSHSDKDWR